MLRLAFYQASGRGISSLLTWLKVPANSYVCLSLCFLVINVMPAQYFYKKRGLANGIVCAGGGLGGTVISLAMNSMIQGIGLAWAYRILGLLTLATGLPAAWIIRERCPAQSASFIEWYKHCPSLVKDILTYL